MDDQNFNDITLTASRSIRNRDYLTSVSGTDESGHTKAIVSVRFIEQFTDGAYRLAAPPITLQGPIVDTFIHAAYMNVQFDFFDPYSPDLFSFWNILSNYLAAQNELFFTDEELMSGTRNGQPLSFPTLEIVIRPLNDMDRCKIVCYNPTFHCIQPPDPHGEPTVLQLTFEDGWYTILDAENDIDIRELAKQALQAQIAEFRGEIPAPVAMPGDTEESPEQRTAREKNYFEDISGSDGRGHPKAHVVFRYSQQYSDGTNREFESATIDKPIVLVYRIGNYKYVRLNFRSKNDVDLRIFWSMLQHYRKVENSACFSLEELEAGCYTDESGQLHMTSFPTIELVLSPNGKETEYQLIGVNPAYFTLQPDNETREPCVLEFVFDQKWFNVIDQIGYVDMAALEQEAIEELKDELNGKPAPHV